jgi:acyl-CoA synthetase (AMP-forming)/AMP-acid ligase II
VSGIGEWARAAPDAAAFISGPGRVTTFGELDDRQRSLAGVLYEGALEEGDRIAILATNREEIIEVATGALRAGIIPVPVNALLTPPEISYVLEDSGARWLFTDRPVEPLPGLEKIVTFGDAYERCLVDASPADISDVTLTRPMHYTSGTTGLPKGVHVAPMNEDEASEISEAFRRLWAIDSHDVHLVCSPLAHSAPLRFSTRTLEAGGSVVLQPRFEAENTLAAIELFGVTSTFMVPTHLERILALGRGAHSRYDRSTMRLLAHAGAPIREDTKRQILDLFPAGSVWEFYGSTEGQATRISTEEWLARPGSVGQSLPGAKVYVMSDEFEKVGAGEVGQVWVLVPPSERFEYWGDEEKTDAAWRDGAFTVGDLGYLDDGGYLYLSGRKNDTIITGGVNVYPQEVEAVLCTHSQVAEVVVYGAPNEEWGQEVRARVVPAPGTHLDVEELRSWARTSLAGFKIPRSIEVVTELEKTATGKLKRPRDPA